MMATLPMPLPKALSSVLFRDNAGGYYNNSIFTDYNDAAIAIEQRDNDNPDSYDRLLAGDLALRNNLFFKFGAGEDPTDLFIAVNDDDEVIMGAASDTVAARLIALGNQIIDPELNSDLDMRDEAGGNLDPRPSPFGFAAEGAPEAEDGFESTAYYGAFEPGNGMTNQTWIQGWTALSALAIIDDDFVNSLAKIERNGFILKAPAPNPAATTTQVEFELPVGGRVSLTVLDMLGRPLANRVRNYAAGTQFETIDVSQLANGTYLLILDAGGNRIVQKLAVSR